MSVAGSIKPNGTSIIPPNTDPNIAPNTHAESDILRNNLKFFSVDGGNFFSLRASIIAIAARAP